MPRLSVLDEEWKVIRQLLPDGWEQAAREHGALVRARGFRNAEVLLRLILMHAAAGLSLKQATVRARVTGLAKVSPVALHKKLKASEGWLRGLTEKMLEGTVYRPRLSSLPQGRKVRAVDGSSITEPGDTGSAWRLHYTLSLPSLLCDFFEVTDNKGGETYKRVPIRKGDLILGDRGYAHREGAAHVVQGGGDVLVRLNLNSFPLETREGKPVQLLRLLRRLKGIQVAEWPVRFESDEEYFAARLCAVRKTKVAAEKAKKKLLKEASKKQQKVQAGALEAAEYIFVLCTVPETELDTKQVLELYRLRWQIELAFKRLKSLLNAGHVPKYDAQSARAWIQAKLLTALLIERLMHQADFFSPWGFDLCTTEHVA
jgi:hypothetical protein